MVIARVSVALVATLWVWSWVVMVEAEYIRYKDPKQPVAIRVSDLLGRMTLQEKIGQMVQIDRSVANVETLGAYSIGNVYFSMCASVLVCKHKSYTFLFLCLKVNYCLSVFLYIYI